MRIGIDLDGVVFDTETLWATLAEIYDCNIIGRNSIIRRGEPRVQEKYDWTDDEVNNYMKEYVDIKEFNIIPGVKEVIKLLREEVHKLIAITARGKVENSLDGKSIARKMLDKENIAFDDFYWGCNNKLETCKKAKIDIMIDDNYHICEDLSNNNIKTLYFRTLGRCKCNNNDNLKEVYSWGKIYRYIKEICKK